MPPLECPPDADQIAAPEEEPSTFHDDLEPLPGEEAAPSADFLPDPLPAAPPDASHDGPSAGEFMDSLADEDDDDLDEDEEDDLDDDDDEEDDDLEPVEPEEAAEAMAEVRRLRARLRRLESRRDRLKSKLKEAKAECEECQGEINSRLDRLNEKHPLFDAVRTAPAPPKPPPPPRDDAEPVVSDPAPTPESWRSTPVEDLARHGCVPRGVSALRKAGIATMGQLADWTSSGKYVTAIPGVGEATGESIENATLAFWDERRKAELEAADASDAPESVETPPISHHAADPGAIDAPDEESIVPGGESLCGASEAVPAVAGRIGG